MRGDRPDNPLAVLYYERFTPHARGSTPVSGLVLFSVLVYPACAGIDRCYKARQIPTIGLPRMRGDRPT